MSQRDNIQAQNVPIDFESNDPEVWKKLEEFARNVLFQLNDIRERLGNLEDKVLE